MPYSSTIAQPCYIHAFVSADPHDVQVLRYQHIGSMHIPRCREGRPPLAADIGPSRQNTVRTRRAMFFASIRFYSS